MFATDTCSVNNYKQAGTCILYIHVCVCMSAHCKYVTFQRLYPCPQVGDNVQAK